jgi:D-alanyl-D-alanine carboxypeptidase
MHTTIRNTEVSMHSWLSTYGRKVIVLALAAVAATAVLTGCGARETKGQQQASAKEVPGPLGAKLQHLLAGMVANPRTGFPGTELYVNQPRLGTWNGAAGKRTVDPSTPMQADDRFHAGSIMKPFIATVVLQLAEEGKLSLDARLPAVLPHRIAALVPEAGRISVRMLLNHTSGIPEYSDKQLDFAAVAAPHRIWKVEEFLARAASRPRQFAPGKGYAYSNTDYNLLGLVIERATGQSWRAAVRERIIDRLGLKHTSLPEPGHVVDGNDVAHGYEVMNGKLRDVSDIDSSMADAAGGAALVTNTEDLSHFLRSLLAGDLFQKKSTLKSMKTFVDAHNDSGLGLGYGLGLERYTVPGGVKVYGHFGTGPGYRAFVGYAPAQRILMSIAFNDGHYAPGDPTQAILRVFQVVARQAS